MLSLELLPRNSSVDFSRHGYEVVCIVGKGQFGTAYKVKRTIDDVELLAKAIDLTSLGERDKKLSIQEAEVMKELDHPNILKYYESFIHNNTFLVIIMEFCQSGDLLQLLEDYRNKGMVVSEVQLIEWVIQLAEGLKYIHSRKILHRDLKPSNILIDNHGKLKIGDFGISRVMNATLAMAVTAIGTPQYMPPEMCENKPYTFKSDIWSLGCIIHEVARLEAAFEGASLLGLVWNIVFKPATAIPLHYSPNLSDFVTSLLSKDPQKRPHAVEVIRKCQEIQTKLELSEDDSSCCENATNTPVSVITTTNSLSIPKTEEIDFYRRGSRCMSFAPVTEDYADVLLGRIKDYIIDSVSEPLELSLRKSFVVSKSHNLFIHDNNDNDDNTDNNDNDDNDDNDDDDDDDDDDDNDSINMYDSNTSIKSILLEELPEGNEAFMKVVCSLEWFQNFVRTLELHVSEAETVFLHAFLQASAPTQYITVEGILNILREPQNLNGEYYEARNWAKQVMSNKSLGALRTHDKPLIDGFHSFDRFREGAISRQHFRTVLYLYFPEMSSSQLDRMFQLANKNAEGEVLYEAYLAFINKNELMPPKNVHHPNYGTSSSSCVTTPKTDTRRACDSLLLVGGSMEFEVTPRLEERKMCELPTEAIITEADYNNNHEKSTHSPVPLNDPEGEEEEEEEEEEGEGASSWVDNYRNNFDHQKDSKQKSNFSPMIISKDNINKNTGEQNCLKLLDTAEESTYYQSLQEDVMSYSARIDTDLQASLFPPSEIRNTKSFLHRSLDCKILLSSELISAENSLDPDMSELNVSNQGGSLGSMIIRNIRVKLIEGLHSLVHELQMERILQCLDVTSNTKRSNLAARQQQNQTDHVIKTTQDTQLMIFKDCPPEDLRLIMDVTFAAEETVMGLVNSINHQRDAVECLKVAYSSENTTRGTDNKPTARPASKLGLPKLIPKAFKDIFNPLRNAKRLEANNDEKPVSELDNTKMFNIWKGRFSATTEYYSTQIGELLSCSLKATQSTNFEIYRQLLLLKEQIAREVVFVVSMNQSFNSMQNASAARIYTEAVGARKILVGILKKYILDRNDYIFANLSNLEERVWKNDYDKEEWVEVSREVLNILRVSCNKIMENLIDGESSRRTQNNKSPQEKPVNMPKYRRRHSVADVTDLVSEMAKRAMQNFTPTAGAHFAQRRASYQSQSKSFLGQKQQEFNRSVDNNNNNDNSNNTSPLLNQERTRKEGSEESTPCVSVRSPDGLSENLAFTIIDSSPEVLDATKRRGRNNKISV